MSPNATGRILGIPRSRWRDYVLLTLSAILAICILRGSKELFHKNYQLAIPLLVGSGILLIILRKMWLGLTVCMLLFIAATAFRAFVFQGMLGSLIIAAIAVGFVFVLYRWLPAKQVGE